MPTYDIVTNIAKGRVAELSLLALTNDALIAVPLAASGLGTAATLRDDATLAAILTHATEQTTMGRKTLTGVTVTTDNTGDKKVVDCDDIVWTAATGAAVAAVAICWDGDTTGGTDANIVPLVILDMPATPNGGDITFQINAAGFFNAA